VTTDQSSQTTPRDPHEQRMLPVYVRVLIVEIVVLLGLWWLQHAFVP
jgi:hypothetical protein